MSVEQLQQLTQEALNTPLATEAEREAYRIHYLGRKGVLKDLAAAVKTIAPENRKAYGLALNALKQTVEQRLADFESSSNSQGSVLESQNDFTRPTRIAVGARHPLALTQNRVIDIFSRMGYSVSDGPEVEDDWHNFSALNFPPDHPARDMQDTFFVRGNGDLALRTHTSSVQIRVMENREPPMRVLAPGRVYRNEAISARAHCFFHQIEGFYVNENVSFADLKLTLLTFARQLFGASVEIRMRPSFFPFTEPSAEVDVSCSLCGGKGCNVCKYTGWLEILGCGMIDPAVLSNCGIDPERYSGFAFGMGVERMAQLLFRVSDLRYYSENDVRFLSQFRPVF